VVRREEKRGEMMMGSFDLVLIAAALCILIVGIGRRRFSWKKGRTEEQHGDIKGLIIYLLTHRPILKRSWAGGAHLALFWGVIIFFVIVIMAQLDFHSSPPLAHVLSFITDIVGIFMLASVLFFLIRWGLRQKPDRPKRILFPLLLLLFIILSGFLAEGTRISTVSSNPGWRSPIGWLNSTFLPDSPLLMQIMIRSHFLGVLVFLAALPFTFMRHITAGTLSVYYRRGRSVWTPSPVPFEKGPFGSAQVSDLSWKRLLETEACVSCSRCDENCPAFLSGKPLSPKRIVSVIRDQVESTCLESKEPFDEHISGDEIWSCTTCMACVEHCPVFVEPVSMIMEMRRHQVMGKGSLPREARGMLRNLEIYGDVQGKGPAHRIEWARDLGVPLVNRDGKDKTLLWVGCYGAFHPRYQDTVRAMTRILEKGAVDYVILGKGELCCGDPARRLGEESLFLKLAERNVEQFRKQGVERIVVLCPHCLQALKHEYSSLGYPLEVVHGVEFVSDLYRKGQLVFQYPAADRVVIHDPCYLGRLNGIYEPSRELVSAIPRTRTVELNNNRESGFCCGGGGGRMWLHESLGKKINQMRSEEVSHTGADVVGTACPYCMTMLDDGLKSLELENTPEVLDIIEIVASSLA
jgi:Fe-S oxidoreductase